MDTKIQSDEYISCGRFTYDDICEFALFVRRYYDYATVDGWTRISDGKIFYCAGDIFNQWMCSMDIHDSVIKFGQSECQNCGIEL
jgi:hypothetical protein